MPLLILIIFFWGSQPANDSSLLNQATEQADYYLQQIRENRRVDLHLWALATLCRNNEYPEIKQFINSNAALIGSPQFSEKPFCGDQSFSEHLADLAFHTGSSDLLLAAVINKKNTQEKRKLYSKFSKKIGFKSHPINYDSLVIKIINQQPIGPSILPFNQFNFPHFLLFFERELLVKGVISREYLKKTSSHWFSQNYDFKHPSLSKSLYLSTLTVACYLIYDYSKVQELYPELYSDLLFPVSDLRLNIYRSLDYSMYRLGYYDKGLEVLRNISIPLAKFLKQKDTELSLLFTQGIYLYKIGKIKEAQAIYEKVFNLSSDQNELISGSSLYNNLSLTYLKSGNFNKYLELQFKALELAEKQNNYSHQLDIYKNLHIVSWKNKDKKSAYSYLKLAQNLAKNYGNITDLASIYLSLGTYYRDLVNDHKLALEYFNKADSLVEAEHHYNLVKKIHTEKAHLFKLEEKYDEALTLYNQVQTLAKQKDDLPVFLEMSANEAEIKLKQGKLDSVKSLISMFTRDNLEQLDFYVIVKAKTIEAHYLVKKNRKEEALQILDPLIEQIVARAKNSTDLESGFWNVEEEYLDAFQLYVDLLIDMGRPEEAVLALDQLKTINDASLFQNPMVKSSQLNESELTQYQHLTNQLDQLRKRLLSVPESEQFEIRSQIDRLNAQKRVLNRKISPLTDQQPVTIREVQNQITGGEVILHITELKDIYYAATITRRKISIQKIKLDGQTRSLFEQAVEEIARGETDLNKLYRIGKILRISELPVMTETIILIPDSYLYELPIDIIPTSKPPKNYSYGEAKYLIEDYRTKYLTSLNELIPVIQNNEKYTWDYVGFGISNFNSPDKSLIPLPYATYEVEQIARELTNLERNKTILDQNSTEETFRNLAPKSKIIHLATHSKVSEQDPLFSTIYMYSADNNSDPQDLSNRIFAYELFEMNLSNELIMLNSCESGSGSYLQGSGIVGISRALRYAGTESLVLNLWSVNDMMASDFAIQFYKGLNDGDSKSTALRNAKLYFLKNKNANPHYWGPYAMIGNDEPIVHPNQKANLYFAAGFMVYLISVVGISYAARVRNGNAA